MLHAMKKAVGTYKPHTPVKDPEFDELILMYKDIAQHISTLSSAVRGLKATWLSVIANIKSVSSAVDASFTSSARAQTLAQDTLHVAGALEQHLLALHEGSESNRLCEAESLLRDYTTLLGQTKVMVRKRGDLAREVDYYRGKVMGFGIETGMGEVY